MSIFHMKVYNLHTPLCFILFYAFYANISRKWNGVICNISPHFFEKPQKTLWKSEAFVTVISSSRIDRLKVKVRNWFCKIVIGFSFSAPLCVQPWFPVHCGRIKGRQMFLLMSESCHICQCSSKMDLTKLLERSPVLLLLIIIRVVQSENPLAICMKSLFMYGHDNSAELLEWLEFAKLTKIGKIYFYYHQLSPINLKVLR